MFRNRSLFALVALILGVAYVFFVINQDIRVSREAPVIYLIPVSKQFIHLVLTAIAAYYGFLGWYFTSREGVLRAGIFYGLAILYVSSSLPVLIFPAILSFIALVDIHSRYNYAPPPLPPHPYDER